MHQVGEAVEPSEYLLTRCINSRERKPKVTPILNRRLATAAAYLLAVMTSLIVGNPVTLASEPGRSGGRTSGRGRHDRGRRSSAAGPRRGPGDVVAGLEVGREQSRDRAFVSHGK